MTDQAAPNEKAAEGSARAGIGARLDEERQRASRLGDLREAILGTVLPTLLGAPVVG